MPQEPTFVGTIKSYNEEKGWGFVTNPVVVQLYGKDVLFRRSGIVAGPTYSGQQVVFAVVQGEKGPLAEGLQPFVPVGANFGPPWGGPSGGYMQMGGGGPGRVGSGGLPAGKPPGKNERYFGVVKTYNEERGWGHIESAGSFQHYGKDVFLLRSAVDGQKVGPGSLVAFKVTMGNKGPQATEVAVLPPGCFGTAEEPGAQHWGTVKSFNEEKGWGFAASDEIQQIFGKDIFFHKRELVSGCPVPTVGDTIQFVVVQGPTGQLEGKRVVSGDGAGMGMVPGDGLGGCGGCGPCGGLCGGPCGGLCGCGGAGCMACQPGWGPPGPQVLGKGQGNRAAPY